MAKSKGDLLAEAQASGVVASDVDEDDVTVDELKARLGGDQPAAAPPAAREPIVAPDGHVVLSQEDIDAGQ